MLYLSSWPEICSKAPVHPPQSLASVLTELHCWFGSHDTVVEDFIRATTLAYSAVIIYTALSMQSQNGSASNDQGASGSVSENVQSARKWIGEWRLGPKEQSIPEKEREVQKV